MAKDIEQDDEVTHDDFRSGFKANINKSQGLLVKNDDYTDKLPRQSVDALTFEQNGGGA